MEATFLPRLVRVRIQAPTTASTVKPMNGIRPHLNGNRLLKSDHKNMRPTLQAGAVANRNVGEAFGNRTVDMAAPGITIIAKTERSIGKTGTH